MHAQERPERAADHHDGPPIKYGAWLHGPAFTLKEHAVRKFPFDKVQVQQACVDVSERRTRYVYDVQFDTGSCQAVAKLGHERLRVLMQITGPVNEIHTEHAQRLLL